MVHFVGAGSGAPDLITVRGKRLLEEADVIIYAGSLVNPAILDERRPGVPVYNSARMTLEEVIGVMEESQREGKACVRLHTGDPSIYGAIREQMDALAEVSQSVIITRMEGRTPVPGKESIESFAAHGASMAIFLSAGRMEELAKRLMRGGYGKDTPAAIVYKASWPEERTFLCTVSTLPQTAQENGITKTALILVGEALTHGAYGRSKLYDPAFTTEYRKGV